MKRRYLTLSPLFAIAIAVLLYATSNLLAQQPAVGTTVPETDTNAATTTEAVESAVPVSQVTEAAVPVSQAAEAAAPKAEVPRSEVSDTDPAAKTPNTNTVLENPITSKLISPLDAYNSGVKKYNAGNFQEAIETFKRMLAIKDAPNTNEALDILARAYTRQAHLLEETQNNLTEAEEYYLLALETFALVNIPYEQTTKELFSFARNRLGVIVYTTRYNPEDETTINELRQAFRHFNEAININKENSSAHNNKGIVYSVQGDSRPAIKAFSDAIDYDANNAIAYLNRGTDNFFIGDFGSALSDFKEVIRYQVLSNMIKDPNEAADALLYSQEMLGFSHLALGNSLYHEGLYDSAIDNYSNALAVSTQLGVSAPELLQLNSNLHLYLGTAYAQKREFGSAKLQLGKALELNPQSADAHNNLGIVYYDEGNFIGAVEYYTRALQLNSELGEAYLNRANAYNQLGMDEKAQSDYEAATQLGIRVLAITQPALYTHITDLRARNIYAQRSFNIRAHQFSPRKSYLF